MTLEKANIVGPFLQATAIQSKIAEARGDAVGFIEVLEQVDSTNAYLLDKPIKARTARVCLAESQSAGRGRRGNQWLSAPYRNILMSISWGFIRWPTTISALALACSCVVAEALNRDYQLDIKIKWPNDLLVDGAKIAGILVDVRGQHGGDCNVVVGLGLNVYQPDWSKLSDYPWQDMAGLGVFPDRNQLAATLIGELVGLLETYAEIGFGAFQNRWDNLNAYRNERVICGRGRSKIVGTVIGTDSLGGLILQLDSGERKTVRDNMQHLRLL